MRCTGKTPLWRVTLVRNSAGAGTPGSDPQVVGLERSAAEPSKVTRARRHKGLSVRRSSSPLPGALHHDPPGQCGARFCEV